MVTCRMQMGRLENLPDTPLILVKGLPLKEPSAFGIVHISLHMSAEGSNSDMYDGPASCPGQSKDCKGPHNGACSAQRNSKYLRPD